MTTATIERELHKVVETQKRFEVELSVIKKAIDEHAFEEVRPEYLKKLARIDAEMDKGKGFKLHTRQDLKKFFA